MEVPRKPQSCKSCALISSPFACPMPWEPFKPLSCTCCLREQTDWKLATYHAWMAAPLKPSTAQEPPHLLPHLL